MTKFGERLTNLRENRGWSKTYVAKAIGLSSMQTYANYEYGRREPDFNTVNKLANLFNVSTDYLLNGKDSKEKLSLDEAIDSVMSFEGRPITEHDRQMMKDLWKACLANKE